MRKHRIALIWKILFAIALGIATGLFFPLSIVRIFETFNALFSQFISFLVPLIIVGLVTPAIFRMGNGAGKMLFLTVVLAYASTVMAGFFSYTISSSIFPTLLSKGDLGTSTMNANVVTPFFTINIPPMLDVMTALVFAFICGIFLTFSKGEYLQKVFDDFEQIVLLTIGKVLIPLLPFYIYGIFLKMSFTGEAGPIVKVFSVVILIIFAISVVWLLILFAVAGFISHKNPFKALGTMLTAYVTALATSSSAATIPITLQQSVKCGVSHEVAGFTIPLCATIHMPGSIIKIVACSITIMIIQGMPFDLGLFSGFIFLLAITMVAAPGVPGGAIMAAIGLMASLLGFSEANQALIIAIYIVMDNFGTACNVTGDGAISLIVNRLSKIVTRDQ